MRVPSLSRLLRVVAPFLTGAVVVLLVAPGTRAAPSRSPDVAKALNNIYAKQKLIHQQLSGIGLAIPENIEGCEETAKLPPKAKRRGEAVWKSTQEALKHHAETAFALASHMNMEARLLVNLRPSVSPVAKQILLVEVPHALQNAADLYEEAAGHVGFLFSYSGLLNCGAASTQGTELQQSYKEATKAMAAAKKLAGGL